MLKGCLSDNKHVVCSIAVEERRGERVAGNVADLQAYPLGKARQSWTCEDSSAEIPIGHIRVSRYYSGHSGSY